MLLYKTSCCNYKAVLVVFFYKTGGVHKTCVRKKHYVITTGFYITQTICIYFQNTTCLYKTVVTQTYVYIENNCIRIFQWPVYRRIKHVTCYVVALLFWRYSGRCLKMIGGNAVRVCWGIAGSLFSEGIWRWCLELATGRQPGTSSKHSYGKSYEQHMDLKWGWHGEPPVRGPCTWRCCLNVFWGYKLFVLVSTLVLYYVWLVYVFVWALLF